MSRAFEQSRGKSVAAVKTSSAVLAVAFLAVLAPMGRGADALNYYKNYFVTGDYTVAGVGLRATGVGGFATGTITMNGVPCTSGVGAIAFEPCSAAGAVASDIVAAYLYWQTEEQSPTPLASHGYFDGHAIIGTVLGNPNNPACWSSGGTVGPPGTFGRVYRADVMPFLPIDPVNSVRLANGAHTVKLVDSGLTGNGNVAYTNGASLVVIYKTVVPGNPLFAPLKSVVVYDGAFTLAKGTAAFTQTIGGFYQAVGSGATMAQIVSNGQSSFAENLSVNGAVISTHPFTGGAGGRWDNPTFGISLAPNAASYSTQVTSGNNQVCLNFAAVVTSTPVVDTDSDGLLDVWETNGIHLNPGAPGTPATFGGCSDFQGEPCVDLPAMGANPKYKDIFLQMDWMHGNGDGTGGKDGHGFHLHMPSPNALNAVCATYAGHNIALHFDVGNNDQGQPCVIPFKTDAYGNQLAQGGSDIDENTLACPNAATATCTYLEPYPVMSFKRGFLSVRDGNPVLHLPGHFAHNRKDSFHYVLFTHALAGPFNSAGQPTTKDPRSVSGIADRPGGDIMISLGLWRTDVPATDQVGSDLVLSGTLMHELGHNLDLSHNGLLRTPNCAPEYPSVMNYMYQTRGLTDALGFEHIDYSTGNVSPALNENSPAAALLNLPYRIRFYGPFNPALNTSDQLAKVHCEGSQITDGAQAVRVEGAFGSTPDWSNGTGAAPLDLNFDGVHGETFTDQPDWSSLNLQQIGGRPNANGFSADVGFADEGFADEGFADEGFADEGFADEGFADEGVADGDVDLDTNTLSGAPSPTSLVATNTINSILLTWVPPSAGQVSIYRIYRCAVMPPAVSCTPSMTPFNTVPGGTATPSFNDMVNDTTDSGQGGSAACSVSTCYNTTYIYTVTAVISAAGTMSESGASTPASSEITHLFVLGKALTIPYGPPIPDASYNVYGDISSTLTGVTCIYSSTPRNVGVYSISCSGPAATSPTDGVTYNIAYLNFTSGVLTITPLPITVTAAASSKVYDATVSSPSAPAITSGSLVYNDSVIWTETYDNPNVGSTHVMTPAGTVSDTNGGKNYQVTFVPIGTGVITQRPASVTPNASGKIFGMADPPLTGTLTGFVPVDNVTATYSRTPGSDAGTYTISAALATTGMLTNYQITYNTANFVISPAPQSITFLPLSNQPLNTPDFNVTASATSGLPVSFTAVGSCTVTLAGRVHLVAVGTCTITASQAGSLDYQPAISVSQSFTITKH
jgi:hypothetical protein